MDKMYLTRWRVPARMRKSFAFALSTGLMLILSVNSRAQAPTISRPVSPSDIVRANGHSTVAVKIVFNAVCSGTVRFGLPASVTYVPAASGGGVTKTGGTAAVSIAESSLSDLSKPEFNISGVAAVGDEITFTIARRADCGTVAVSKDTVYFIAGAGCANTSDATGDTYSLLAPSFSITPAPAISGAVVGTTATRTTTITNGGNGASDTVRFYVVYKDASIVNTSGTNAIIANSTGFTPWRTSGDTLFYKIYGATLFGGDNHLTSGETVTITEPIRVAKCGTPANATVYSASWGRTSELPGCQSADGTSAVTMAVGVPNVNIRTSDSIVIRACSPGISKTIIKNIGSGGVAGALFNVIANIGFSDLGGTMYVQSNGEFLDNITMGAPPGVGITVATDTIGKSTLGSNARIRINMNQFASDPDGPGGLSDLDADGFYDDIAPGDSIVLYFTRNYKPNTACPRANYSHNVASALNYDNMCGLSSATLPANGYGGTRTLFTIPSRTYSTVPQVFNGVPFTVTISHYAAIVTAVNQSVDSFELTLTLPVGLTYVPGTFKFRGGAVPDAGNVTVSGSTVQLRRKWTGTNYLWFQHDFTFDLVYDCSGGGSSVGFSWEMDYVNTRSCGDIVERLYCGSTSLPAVCPSPCPGGLANIFTKAERTSLGWTDGTLSAKISPSSISAEQLATVLPYDTVVVTNTAKQSSVAYDNVHFSFELDNPASGHKSLQFISGVYYHKSAASGIITSAAISAPADSSYGSLTHTRWDWNLSALSGMPSMPLSVDDSIWVEVKYGVTNANNSGLYGNVPTYAPNASSYFYSNDPVFAKQYCLALVPSLRFVGMGSSGSVYLGSNSSGTLVGCNNAYPNVFYNTGYGVNYRIFNNEFRPKHYVDSIVVILPAGVQYNNAVTPTIMDTRWISTYDKVNTTTAIAHPIINGQRLTFVNPGSWRFNDITPSGTQADSRLYYALTANCAVGSTTGPLPLLVQYYGKDYYYANSGANMVVTTSYSNDASFFGIDGTKRPSLTVQNNTGTIQGVNVSQYWDVQVSNTSTVTAPYVWLALEKAAGSGGVVIDSVKLLPSLSSLPMTGVYNGTDKWYQLSAAGIASGGTQQARVFFHYTSCTKDSIQLKAGWNCGGYPGPDPSAYACTAASTYLVVDPQPSQVQLSVLRHPGAGSTIGLCTEDSVKIVVQSAQAANLVNPYLTFYPPTGVTLGSPILVEYPRASGLYQALSPLPLSGGGYQINLSGHPGIGTAGILGTANANPAFSPLGGDREAVVTFKFTTDCNFTSGAGLRFNVFGNRPCGLPALGNGITGSTNGVNITGAGVAGSAGISMTLSSPLAVSCGDILTVNQSVLPTSVASMAGDTIINTLGTGLGYAGGLTAGFAAVVSGGGSTPVVVKVAMPAGYVAPGVPINYSFNVTPQGGGCNTTNITAEYQRNGAVLTCSGSPCPSASRTIIASGTSPDIALNKPSLTINGFTKMDDSVAAWPMDGWENRVRVRFTNNGTQAYMANTDTIEFFCDAAGTVPFFKAPVTKNIAIGATDSSDYSVYISSGLCTVGQFPELRIQTVTAANTPQCLCNEARYISTYALPLGFIKTTAVARDCAVYFDWEYNQEENVDHFVIERSSTGSGFSGIQELKAGERRFIDVTPQSGTWYYRLKAVKLSGESTYTNTMVVHTSKCVGNSVAVYPNPAQDKIQIVLQGNTSRQSYVLYDMIGRMVKQANLNANSNNTIEIDNLPKGSYMLRVLIDEQSSIHQVQIAR